MLNIQSRELSIGYLVQRDFALQQGNRRDMNKDIRIYNPKEL